MACPLRCFFFFMGTQWGHGGTEEGHGGDMRLRGTHMEIFFGVNEYYFKYFGSKVEYDVYVMLVCIY